MLERLTAAQVANYGAQAQAALMNASSNATGVYNLGLLQSEQMKNWQYRNVGDRVRSSVYDGDNNAASKTAQIGEAFSNLLPFRKIFGK